MSTAMPTLSPAKNLPSFDLDARWLEIQTDLVIDGFDHWTNPVDAFACPSMCYSCHDVVDPKSV